VTKRPARFKKGSRFVVVSLTLFCCLGIWTVFESAPLFFQAAAQTAPAADGAKPAAPLSAADIEAKSKDLERQMDYVEKLLAALVTVGTIFGLALGLTTYANAKDLQDRAEKDLARVKEEAKRYLDDIRADFPAIGRLNHRISDILNDITLYGNLKLDELDGKGYAQLKPAERQEILLQEMTFSALNCFDHARSPDLKDSAANVNIVLGRFYGSRYHFDRSNNVSDLPRALVYNFRGLETSEKEILQKAKGALGVLHLWQSYQEPDPKERERLRMLARGYYDAAQKPGVTDPKRLVALAWLDRREGHLQRAIDQLGEVIQALESGKLSPREAARFSEPAYKNRACYLAEQKKFDLAMKDLWKARSAAILYEDFDAWVADLKAECSPEGDLFGLASDVAYAGELVRMHDPASVPPA
jgi:hypothetical protein